MPRILLQSAAGDYEIDDDPSRVDPQAAVAFLTTEAYWGRWRDGEDIRRQIAGAWRVVGAYDRTGAMVGFARAFGDGGSAYLADVYVLPGHRGAGLGQAVVRMMIEDGPGAGWRWMLHTSDAHGLYRQFGFARSDGSYLERSPCPEAAAAEKAPATGSHLGKVVRLEPLQHHHVRGLVAAAAGGGALYRWTHVPQDEDQGRRYVEGAVAAGHGKDRRAFRGDPARAPAGCRLDAARLGAVQHHRGRMASGQEAPGGTGCALRPAMTRSREGGRASRRRWRG
jgi:GNAT superfamily N-acetyltransferase